jgi:hypothetical protein
MKMKLTMVMIAMIAAMSIPSVFASHPIDSSDTASCIGDGHDDGRNNPFSQEIYDICGKTYYDAFIEGCMSVEGNTREVCESATDAD